MHLDSGFNEKRTISNACTGMVNKENYYQEYKGHTKWLSLISSHFAKNNILARTCSIYLHVYCLCKVSEIITTLFNKNGQLDKVQSSLGSSSNIYIQYLQTVLRQKMACKKKKKASVKAMVQVDFPVHALSKHKQNPYLKANRKKCLNPQRCQFVKKYFLASSFFTQMCLYCAGMLWSMLISLHVPHLYERHTK